VTAHLAYEGLHVQAGGNLHDHTTAVFDRDPASPRSATYRYVYSCRWSTTLPSLQWWCHNPSTATALHPDMTVTKIHGFTRRAGVYGGFDLLNRYALRSTDPELLDTYPFPVGPRNDEILAAFAGRPAPIVAAWGAIPCDPDRARQVHDLLAAAGATVLCLGTTDKGHPRHPSRLPYTTKFEPYKIPKAAST